MKTVKNIVTNTISKGKKSTGFTTEEQAAMKARIQELKGKAGGDSALLAAIAKMPAPYRIIGERLHAIIKTTLHRSRRKPGTVCQLMLKRERLYATCV
jgi:hypothetical protein